MYCVMRTSVPSLYNVYRRYGKQVNDTCASAALSHVHCFLDRCYTCTCSCFKKFTRLHKDIVSKYKCSVQKHIVEGICLPLSVATLNKHIATRRR